MSTWAEEKERCYEILNKIKDLYSVIADFKRGFKIKGELKVGLRTTSTKKITYVDVFLFSLISGNWNPLHHDEVVVSRTKFGKRVVHGLLTSSLASTLVEEFPGLVVLLSTSFRYKKPVYLGDTIHGEVIIIEKLSENRFKVSVKFVNQDHEEVVDGECMILVWNEEYL